ncbi:unnamed protein product [Cylicocyclus nassatus]|uniref:DEP domain-containing protein n=1 Tax=Cylicocyclus nassatus TaxID=53992 RepID=A0AA36MC07_CYLNA|nr:unnamed protein product [Cylicocyclus nassatus]
MSASETTAWLSEKRSGQSTTSPAPSQCRFSTTQKYQNMKNYFRRQIEKLHRENGEFSGSEAVNILEEYLQANREQFSAHVVKRENAVKVLDMWLRENVISPLNSNYKDPPSLFQDSKRSMYVMNRDEDHKLYICASPMNTNRESSRRPSRSSSFKRFFSPGRSKCPEAATNSQDVVVSRSPSSISVGCDSVQAVNFVLNPVQKFVTNTVQQKTQSRPLAEEVRLHDAALFRLLTIVDVPMLDDITSLPGHESKSVSILSSILSKMGFSAVSAAVLHFKDEEEMDDLLHNTPAIKPIVPWFQMARICAPTLHFKSSGSAKPSKTEVHNWAKQSLQAVSSRYSSITHRGSSPLIPTEFTSILEAIVNQLLGKKGKKTKLALQYLCLMIPQQVRSHLVNVVHFLLRTIGTDEYMSIRSPFYLGKKGDNENFEVVLNELRPFIFPQSIEIPDQNSIVEVLMQLQKEGSLGKETPELTSDLQNMSCRANADKATVPIRYCEAESSVKGFDVDAELARALSAIIDDPRITLAEKQKKCELFKQHHPKMYRRYFAHLSW